MTDIYKKLEEEIDLLGGIDKVLELDMAAMNRYALKNMAYIESSDAKKMFNSDEFQKKIDECQRIRATLAK